MERSGYDGAADAQLNEITIYGLSAKPSSVVVNNRSNASFTWEPDNKVTPPPPSPLHTYTSFTTNCKQSKNWRWERPGANLQTGGKGLELTSRLVGKAWG